MRPSEKILTYSPGEWETFAEEALTYCGEYREVSNLGGASDQGRDLCAHVDDEIWDLYQCKHYRNPLTPSVIWPELGKLMYYTDKGTYTRPRRYRFVSPRGVGPKLYDLLRNPSQLRAGLVNAWDSSVRDAITNAQPIELTEALRQHVHDYDFTSIFYVPPSKLIGWHLESPYAPLRFNAPLPQRPSPDSPPHKPDATEARYLQQLITCYCEHAGAGSSPSSVLEPGTRYEHHLTRARVAFYSALGLERFSIESVPPGAFQQLTDSVFSGVIDTAESTYPDGFARVLATIKTAQELQLASEVLHERLRVDDRHGICHKLVNDYRMNWTTNNRDKAC